MSEQLAGAVLLLVAFWTTLSTQPPGAHPPVYLVSNIVGSVMLAETAVQAQQWGVVLLEGAWSVVALVGLAVGSAAPPLVSKFLGRRADACPPSGSWW
ncbi:hypothetical protein ACFQ1S_07705 [Kibdelosporangium lantanae]|uniref:CBU-0592-like domain-containing protein n=1 Tax=Kibdelosporangium lantanae TaxID=1497396 RepID=A0ABW3M5Z9_9PSEU